MYESLTRLLYRIPEGAVIVGISRALFYREINCGAIKTVHIGGSVRVTADELRRYVTALTASENERDVNIYPANVPARRERVSR